MNKKYPPSLFAVALLCGFLSTGPTTLQAQNFYTWNPLVTNGLWNDVANWDGGVVPNEAGAVVFFDNTANITVNLNGFAATLGELNIANNATFGSTTNTDDIINLDNAAVGQPLISVAAGSAFMYAEITGTNGFRKTGAGRLSFRFNPNNQAYSGNITLGGGTLGINQNGSLGADDNDLIFETSSTLSVEPSAVATNPQTVVLPATRAVQIASGATATVSVGEFVGATIAGDITGEGGLSFAGAGTLVLTGSNSYTGATTVNWPGFGGTSTNTNVVVRSSRLAFGGAASLPATNPLVLSFGTSAAFNSSSTVVVDLGGGTLNPATLVIGNNTATTSTNSLMAYDITNGGLVFSDPANTLNFSARGAGNVTNDLRLPNNANLTYGGIVLGGISASVNAMNYSRLLVGSNATLNTAQISMAAWRASGSIEARAPGASLKLRGTDGTSPVPQILIGNFSGGPNPVATINFSNGSVDIAATTIEIAKNVANNSGANGSLQFGGGTATADTLVVAVGAQAGNATVTVTNTNFVTGFVTQNGGTATFSNVILGRSLPVDPTRGPVLDRYTATYNLNGGTLATALINTDSTNAAVSGMSRTFNLNGGTLRALDASTDLTVTARTNAFSAIAFVAGTTNDKTITVDAGRSINFSAAVAAQFNGGTTTFGLASNSVANLAGRFQLGVATTNNAAVAITNGTVNLSSATGIFGIGDRTVGSSALNIAGGNVNIALANANRMLVGNKGDGSINVTGGTLTVTGTPDIIIGGDIAFAATNAAGTITVSGGLIDIQEPGIFLLGQNQTNGATTGATGRLNINPGGTFRTVRAIQAGTNGVSTGEVNLNGGTLAAGADIANLLNVTAATVASNSIFDTGSFDSGIGQNLAGTGTLTVVGTGTLRLNGTNTPAVVVDSGATLGGTGSAGSVTVNGTIAPGASATNGTFTSTTALAVPGTARFRLFANGINDKIMATAGANLSGGTVAVTVDTNYTPAGGDSFDLVDGAITGTPVLNLPALSGGLTWDTNSFLSTGSLSVSGGAGPTNNYASWLSSYPSLTGAATNGTADPDGDGFSNNLEYAFDGNPTVGTPALMTVTTSGTNAVFNWIERKNPPGGVVYAVQKSGTLTGGWSAATGLNISNSATTNGILIPADYVRREFVVPASGRDFYRVEATINN